MSPLNSVSRSPRCGRAATAEEPQEAEGVRVARPEGAALGAGQGLGHARRDEERPRGCDLAWYPIFTPVRGPLKIGPRFR